MSIFYHRTLFQKRIFTELQAFEVDPCVIRLYLYLSACDAMVKRLYLFQKINKAAVGKLVCKILLKPVNSIQIAGCVGKWTSRLKLHRRIRISIHFKDWNGPHPENQGRPAVKVQLENSKWNWTNWTKLGS